MMKKYFMISLAALLMAACSNENEPETNSKGKTITIQATIDNGNASRIALGESDGSKTPIVWKVGDEFLLNGYTFTATRVESDGLTATFTSDYAPEELEDGEYSAEYGEYMSDYDAEQVGIKDGISDYIYMTAECTVSDGKSYEGLTLNFTPQTPIVHATLRHEAFKGNTVNGISLATPYGTITTTSIFTGSDDNGTVEVYFVMPPAYVDIEDKYTIVALCGGKYYDVALGTKTLEANKLYHVTRDMVATSPQKTLHYQIALAEDGATLTLTEDLIVSEMLNELNFAALTIPAGKSITIDGGGNTISVADDAASGLILFQVYGSLTLKNITLDADKEGVQPFWIGGNVVLGEKTTAKGSITVNGALTLDEGSSVTCSTYNTMSIQGGTVTFNGGSIGCTDTSQPYEIYLDMYSVEENYIPLVLTERATAAGAPLRFYVWTTDANTTQVATVNYTGADVTNDFKLYNWWYGEDQTPITGGTFSITDGKLMLNAPATE